MPMSDNPIGQPPKRRKLAPMYMEDQKGTEQLRQADQSAVDSEDPLLGAEYAQHEGLLSKLREKGPKKRSK